ncbi:hypothetical protein ACR2XN_29080, partial [Klebsiella pneumoniae]
QYPSFPFQNQQYRAWPYNPSEMQQQQEQQFYYPYEPVHQNIQPPECQQQQFHTDYGQQSNEEAELEELRLIIKGNALSLQTMENQIDHKIVEESVNVTFDETKFPGLHEDGQMQPFRFENQGYLEESEVVIDRSFQL